MTDYKLIKLSIPQMPLESRQEHLVTINAESLVDIPAALKQWKCFRTILVVSRSLALNTDYVLKLQSQLGSTVVSTKLGVGSHSPYADIIDIARLLHNTNADSLVCVGSGSYTDACKTARLLHSKLGLDEVTEENMEGLIDQDLGTTKHGVFLVPKTKLILVPCSLSVGEYNPVSSATNSAGKKQHFGDFDPPIGAADLILLDPELMVTVPPQLWLPSGARAIDHCIESICSNDIQEEGVKAAERALPKLIRGLNEYKQGLAIERDRRDASILQGISESQQGAREAITALFCYGSHMGPSHAIGHQLGSVGRVAHGLTSCICLPAVLRYEKSHPDNKHWNVGRQTIILAAFNNVLGWHETEAADAVEKFFISLNLPTKLSEVGVTSDAAVRRIAELTMTDIWGGGPKQISEPEVIVELLSTAR